MRADIYLTENKHCESRSKASRLIYEGKVLIDGRTVEKPSFEVSIGAHKVEITETDKYVSRGGLKLEYALDAFNISVASLRCIDIGASTGGFTDCLLQRGADSVCALDSGSGQLHPKLLADERVRNIEGFNARELTENFGIFDIAVTDVSFISQTLIHKGISRVLPIGGIFVSLIKPQFEAGKSALGKGGIVKDPKDREFAVKRVIESAALFSLELKDITRSPIKGGDGNRELLAVFVKREGSVLNTVDKQTLRTLCAD